MIETINVNIPEEQYANYGLGQMMVCSTKSDAFIDKYVIKELQRIQQLATEKGISIVFFKGYVEKYDTYYLRSWSRFQSDIDVLVNMNDIIELCEIFNSVGFHTKSGDNIERQWINNSLSDSQRHHLPIVVKTIFGGAYDILVEIHFVLNTAWNSDTNRDSYVNAILNERVLRNKVTALYEMNIY